MNEEIRERLKDYIVLVPSLNPDEKLMQVVRGMLSAGFSHVLLVNDGSDQAHTGPFTEAESLPECTVLTHDVNEGKGRALKTAFSYIIENLPWAKGVITVDGDNQHTKEDTVNIAMAMLSNRDHVIMGCRNFKLKNVPTHNRLGNTLTSMVFKGLCGIKLSDTQTGLRGIPASCLKAFTEVEGERFEYETNMLLYMKTAGIPFIEVPIQTVYIEDNKTSHFNPLKDSIKIYKPIIKFAGGSILSCLIDLAVFTVAIWFLKDMQDYDRQILYATVVARVLSSMFNYGFNKKAVFASDEPMRTTIVRYYVLCIVQMLISYKGVSLLVGLTAASGFGKTLLKLIVDCILFLLTFQIQREWVFKKKKTGSI